VRANSLKPEEKLKPKELNHKARFLNIDANFIPFVWCLGMFRIKDIMVRDVKTVDKNATVSSAASIMSAHNIVHS